MFPGICASVASWTKSERRPGVEDMRGVSRAAVDVSPRMASFRGAGNDAGSWKMKPMQGSTHRDVKRRVGKERRIRTSVDEWPGAHVDGTPEAATLYKVPPVPVTIAEHVLSGLFVVVQSVFGAGCTRVRGREELVDGETVCRLGAC
jgi:hypothetical protein